MLVPAVSGDFGVLPGHVPTVAQLKPGTMTVHNELDKDVKKYFVSSGFAFVHANSSCDVVAVEAVPLEDLDLDMVKAGLAEYTGKVVSAKDDLGDELAPELVRCFGVVFGAAFSLAAASVLA